MSKRDDKNLAMLAWVAAGIIGATVTSMLKTKAEDQQKADELYAEEEAQHQQQQEADRQHQQHWENEQRQRGEDMHRQQVMMRAEMKKQQRLFTPKKIAFAIITSIIGSVVWVLLAG